VYVIAALGLANDLARTIAIVVLAVFGLVLMIPPLAARVEAATQRLVPAPARPGSEGFGSGFLVGASLGFVYAPCAGPILAGVITVSAAQDFTFGRLAVALAYSIGSAAVLYLLMIGGRRITDRLAAYRRWIQPALGAVMVATAVVMATNLDVRFESAIAQHLPSAFVDPTSRIEQSSAVSGDLAALRGGGPTAKEGGSAQAAAGERLPDMGLAPDFVGNQMWFNTPGDRPLSLGGNLRGHVVLVDFWTYTCVNCIRTLPYLEDWYRRYHRFGFDVVGVHTPEFPFEREASNVSDAIGQFGLTYPVAQDNDYATWDAYRNQYWPADYLVDAQGHVRYVHFGEGDYGAAERAIRGLLAASGHPPTGGDVRVRAQKASTGLGTPETYLGAAKAQGFVGDGVHEGTATYRRVPAADLGPNDFAFGGRWTITQETAAAAAPGASIELRFLARRVFCVLGSVGEARGVRVLLDGKPIPQRFAGKDVRDGVAKVTRHRLYELVNLPRVGDHTLELRFARGVSGYASTFG
jgi:thiol-disulfide isomerase/thioredoxin